MADSARTWESAASSDGRRPTRLLIVGLGNQMMGDDGIGHAVLSRLEDNRRLPQQVRLVAFDGDVLSLFRVWDGEPSVWLVDAVSSQQRPGTVCVYDHKELLELPAFGFSVHHASLGESLRWLLHACPEMAMVEFRLFGIEAGVVAPGRGLSRRVGMAIGNLVDEVATQAHELVAPSRTAGPPHRLVTSF